MKFLKGVNKTLESAGITVGASEPPRYWFSLGNHCLNRVTAGSFFRGIPQGRVTGLAGPSGSGKSFLACNAMREAQKEGAYIVVLDSENALDDEFVSKIGVDISPEKYSYISIDTIPQCKKVVSTFLQGYIKEYGADEDAPPILFVIDSLDMLETETEAENFKKGITKGDQGQRNKQLKAMLRGFVQATKRYNVSMIVTSQVYKNQDLTNGEGIWIVADAVKYSLSQIILLSKLKLKEKDSTDVLGIRMKCEGYKTRFTKPFQVVTIQVPYETGMDPYNGLIDVAIALDVIVLKGAWCYFGEYKWQGKKLPPKYAEEVLMACEAKGSEKFLDVIPEGAIEVVEDKRSARTKRTENNAAKQDGEGAE